MNPRFICLSGFFLGLLAATNTLGGEAKLGQADSAGRQKSLQIGKGTKPFDVTRHSVELREIVQGGPPRDAIPALIDPKFVTAAEALKFMREKDEILGVVANGGAKAYLLKILNYHEVVNDRVGGRPVTVTY